MAKNYQIVKAGLGEEWDSFVSASPDVSVFLLSDYLENINIPLGLYAVYNANELRAVVALAQNQDGSSAILDDLLVYSGVCMGAPAANQVHSQVMSERHDVTAFIAAELSSLYNEVSFALSPSIDDIRPFLWYNYGQDAGGYHIDVRYTSYVRLGDFRGAKMNEDIKTYRDASVARRQQIRYAKRDGVATEEICNVDLFIDFYRRTMERQGESVCSEQLARMKSLTDALIKKGIAVMYGSRTREGELGSISVFALDPLRAYYLFGANDPAYRNTPTGTAALWDAFHDLAARGVNEVDLEGVNSPRRGWFKLSFGGDLRPYYQVSKHG